MHNMRTTTRSRTRSVGALAMALAAPLGFAACDTGATPDVEEARASAVTLTQNFSNPSGQHATVSTTGSIDQSNEFFQSLGTNGRSCVTCHDAAAAWGITPGSVTQRFNATGGTDPIFRLNDGAVAPNMPVGTLAQRQAAYSDIMARGRIRVGIGIPANAEFSLVLVEDPYHYASATELSLFRRPLPSTNLKFVSGVMWDGRETVAGNTMAQNLAKQSNDATLGHAQATVPLTATQQNSIVNFESALFTAQVSDNVAGSLSANGALGGPSTLSQQAFYIGINDPLGGNPTGTPFTNKAFTLFDAWANKSGTTAAAQQASIARGQAIFNTRAITISGVRGVNDVLGVTSMQGTCTTCHDSPNVGNHSVGLPLDLGLTGPNTFNTDTTPRYTLCKNGTDCSVQSNLIKTSDPGRALITGKWSQVATFKGPILRGLASRAPYFHNGFAASLTDVVKFYDTRFHIGLDAQSTVDLAAFLQSL
jgi:cytochrome c peroxidase